MKTIKQLLITITMVLYSATASAHDFEVDGIYYNICSASDLTVAVTYKGSSYNEFTDEYSGDVIIPETVIYKSKVLKVIGIGYRAFESCPSLTSVVIGNNVTSIGNRAFEGCLGLKSVNIKDIAAWCEIDFEYKAGVNIWYSTNPLYYAHNLFLNGEKVTELVIPNSVTCIREATFYHCSSLTSVKIPNNVTSIESCAFAGCSGLTSVKIPNSVTSIGGSAFENCSSLTSIEIPNSVTSIGEGAFSGCSSLKKVEFNCPIVQGWFQESSIEDIIIGNSVTRIGGGAFNGCKLIKNLFVEDGTDILELGASYYNSDNRRYYGLFYESPLETLYLGRNISVKDYHIYTGHFYNSKELTSVTIGPYVTRIEEEEFEGCSKLTSIVLGKSIKSIGYGVFKNCSGLTNILSLSETPPSVGDKNFTQTQYTDITLYVPVGALETYQAADTWKNFWDIQEEGATEAPEDEVKKCATPAIAYNNNGFYITSETEGAEIHTDITCSDVNSYSTGRIDLSAIYNITTYATKSGCLNSETATATLCWIAVNGSSEENGIIEVEAMPVLITCNNGTINISGGKDGAEVIVYNINGVAIGNATITNGNATISTSLAKGEIVIVNIAGMGIKVAMQ